MKPSYLHSCQKKKLGRFVANFCPRSKLQRFPAYLPSQQGCGSGDFAWIRLRFFNFSSSGSRFNTQIPDPDQGHLVEVLEIRESELFSEDLIRAFMLDFNNFNLFKQLPNNVKTDGAKAVEELVLNFKASLVEEASTLVGLL